jgi:hypothetical protein
MPAHHRRRGAAGGRRVDRRHRPLPKHAAADGNGAWIVSTYEARLFTWNQAVAALGPRRAPGRRVRRRRPARHRLAQGVEPSDRPSLTA